MKHVVAFDVSKDKSTLVIYKDQKHCIFEGELVHSQADFKILHERMVTLAQQSGEKPEIVFEATGVYSMALEKFFKIMDTNIIA